MGNRPTKIRYGAPSQGNQRAANDGDPASPSTSESSSSKEPLTPQVHCREVFIFHITPQEHEVYILVPSEEMEGERPQENIEKSGEMPSVAVTSETSEVASAILDETNITPELTDSTTEQTIGLDSACESCQLLLPEASPMPPPKTYTARSSAEHTSDCSSPEEGVAAELASVGTLSVGMAEPWEGTKDLHPSSELSKGSKVPESDQKVSCEMDHEFTTNNVQGTAEEQAPGQRELDEASSEEALQRTTEPHPNLILAETPNGSSIVMVALAHEQLAEGQTSSVSETEGLISEERSPVESWKEREDLCSPKEVPTEAELQPDDQKVPSRMRLELTTENTQIAAETPTTLQRRLDDDASPELAVDIEPHLDSTLVETSGGASSMGTAPGHDLPLAVTKMEGKISGDCSRAENKGKIIKALSSQLEMPPVETQDKTLARVEVGDKTACPIASSSPLEKELDHTLTQSLSTAEEGSNSNVQLLDEAEFLDAAQVDEDTPTLEAMLSEGPTAVQAQSPAEVTMVQSSPETLLGAAETMKEREEASPDQSLAEETIEQAGSPEAQLPPETAPPPLWVSDEEEDAEFFEATDTFKAAVWDWVLKAQEKHNDKDDPTQFS